MISGLTISIPSKVLPNLIEATQPIIKMNYTTHFNLTKPIPPACEIRGPQFSFGSMSVPGPSCTMNLCGNNTEIMQRCCDGVTPLEVTDWPYSTDTPEYKADNYTRTALHCHLGDKTPDDFGKCADGLHAVHQWTCNNDTETTHNATTEDPGSMSNGTMVNKTEENSGLKLELGGWSSLTMGWSVMGLLLSTLVAL